jgi:hypothetical protein
VPAIEFILLSRVVHPGLHLVEAAGTAELSAIGPDAAAADELLRKKLKDFFSDEELAGALGMHRRRMAGPFTVGRIDVRLDAPRRAKAWQEALRVPLPRNSR